MTNNLDALCTLRTKLEESEASIGGWLQFGNSDIAELMSSSKLFDWMVVDLEHGALALNELRNLCRAIEAGYSIPLARVPESTNVWSKIALEAGCAGVIFPNISNSMQLSALIAEAKWPPGGDRGVGFSRSNLYGEDFFDYLEFAQNPLIIAMIESKEAVKNISEIVGVRGLDAILVGPYDLSASVGTPGNFESVEFIDSLQAICSVCASVKMPYGIHVVDDDPDALMVRIKEGYTFVAYGMDSMFIRSSLRALKALKHEI